MLVTENQLDQWVRGNARDAQGAIVELVWRLVAASCPRPRERRFPLGDSIGQHGPDGILDDDLGFEPFVPESRSFWEIGTGLEASDKATSDYDSLTAAVPLDVRLESTFVFVTPLSGRREWKHTWKGEEQAAWLRDRRSRREWKDVQVIDGTRLIDWVHQFLAVELWLTHKISGLTIQQIETPEQRWDILRSIGEPPPLTPDVFLASRAEACAKLKEVFDGTVVQLKLTTHFPDQVTDFVSAYLASLGIEDRIDAESRCLIVSGTDAWATICTSQREKHILIADAALDLSGEAGTKLIQKARRAGHAVVFGGPYGGIPDPASIPLPIPPPHEVEGALAKAGYSEERARTLAKRSGGHLGSLLRCLQNLSLMPEWAERSEAADLAVAMVLGAWSDKLSADRTVVECLSGNSYGEWIGKMREIVLSPGTPLSQRDGNWKFLARYEGWYTLGPRLGDEHLDRLKSSAVSVLREKDPQFDLPKEERHAAQIYGKVLTHSHRLRKGIAESLALLGSHPQALTSCSSGKAVTTAILTVREVLDDADWTRWASLNDILPLLAEAAPGEFLDAVEKALSSDPCPFDEVFDQESGAVFGRIYITGLLWALETLAWDTDHLSRVVMCLGELAARDPGGQWANRPANSLTAILLPWLPQTCAPISKRVAAVKALLSELSDVGWKLLVSLLPQSHSVSSGTRKPAWRATIPDDWSKGVTTREYWEQVEQYAEIAVTAAQGNRERLSELISRMDTLSPPARRQLLIYLGSRTVIAIPEADRLHLWNQLISLVTKHRRFADAEWAMKREEIENIEEVADRLAPKNPFFRHQRLFTEGDYDLYERKGDYDEQRKQLEKLRETALEEIVANEGVEAVIAFAEAVQSPWRVGIAFGVIASPETDSTVLPKLLESHQKPIAQFAGGFVWSRFRSRGWEWIDNIDTQQWSAAQIGHFFSYLPFAPDTWERVKQALGEDESAYWAETNANPYETDKGLELAIDRLVEYGRPFAALRCLDRMLHAKQPLDTQRAVRVLLAALESAESRHAVDTHGIVDIIKALQDDPSTDPKDLVQVEWAYLPLLDRHNAAFPKFLERSLATDPGFFCEVIRLVFRSKKEDPSKEEPTEGRKNVAANAYRLLSEWRTPPGLQEDGTYDGAVLSAWVDAMKKECKESGHLEVASIILGHVLTYVPPASDGLWIHHAAAVLLSAKDANDMRNGFRTQLYNSRGTHWVDPTGKPERELAAKYREQAEAVEGAGYHRLAVTLRELAETYEREAERVSSREHFDD
ncbi:MAG: hypothetical protein AB1402_10215 [Bacillota bacterium]